MTGISALWLPLLLSTVFVFLASWIIHMAPLWHKNSYPRLEKEDQVRAALGPLELPVGDYMVPRCKDHAEMRTPEFMEKMKAGPVVLLTVMPKGDWKMGATLAQWVLYCGVVGCLSGCVAGSALPPGADRHQVCHLVGATAFAGYALALFQMSIWYKRGWGLTLKAALDGLIYAALTAATYAWLWPK